jgi:Nuclease-related domain
VNLNQALSSLYFTLAALLIVGLPVFLMIGMLEIWRWRRRRFTAPVTDKLLRSPGESLRKEIEALDDKLLAEVFVLIFYGPFFFYLFGTVWQQRKSSVFPVLIVMYGAMAVGAYVYLVIRMFKFWRKRSDYMLGFSGERAVGEELNKLMLDGCRIFHDLPGGLNWNIDHVVVAPSGVYVIETKTRRKVKAPRGSKKYEIYCDGERLEPPHDKSLAQAKNNAKSLSSFLSGALAEKIWVSPVLTFPGWFVVQRGKPNPDWAVLNHKQIRGYIIGRPTKLMPERIQQIAHQLDQKCRDVEF